MFNVFARNGILELKLSGKQRFDAEFHCQVASFLHEVISSRYSVVQFNCCDDINFEGACKLYLHSMFCFLTQKHKVAILGNSRTLDEFNARVQQDHNLQHLDVVNLGHLLDGMPVDRYYHIERNMGVAHVTEEIAKFVGTYGNATDSQRLLFFLTDAIGEIFTNSMEHSTRTECFLMCDVLNNDGRYFLDISVTDYGSTIEWNVRNYLRDQNLLPRKCVEWALIKGHTTKDRSGGYGLSMIAEYAEAMKGSLIILTGGALYHLDSQGLVSSWDIEGYFYGTTVSIRIELRNIDRQPLQTGINGLKRISLMDIR